MATATAEPIANDTSDINALFGRMTFIPKERSEQLSKERIIGTYEVADIPVFITFEDGKILGREDKNIYRHFLVNYEVPRKPIEEVVSDRVRSYSTQVLTQKPTDDQIRFNDSVRTNPDEDVKTFYRNAGINYDNLIDLYNEAVSAGLGVEEAFGYCSKMSHIGNDEKPDTSRNVREENPPTSTDDDQIITIYFSTGTDLRDVASYYYGSEETWQRLAEYNGLTEPKLEHDTDLAMPSQEYFAGHENVDKPIRQYSVGPVDYVVLKKGTDLEEVSANYLGRRDAWSKLAVYNGLDTESNILSENMKLAIPPLSYFRT
ncbi:MAG: hypothetical protein WC613_03585 [Candidatus Aenigmatarchaeota archaeon]